MKYLGLKMGFHLRMEVYFNKLMFVLKEKFISWSINILKKLVHANCKLDDPCFHLVCCGILESQHAHV